MPQIIVVVRELGRVKPDYWLPFDVPEVPAVGSYLSIQRPDRREPFGEDLIVRHVWWRLAHPETGSIGSDPPKVGSLTEIFVECDPALSPYSSDHWRKMLEAARDRGVEVVEFDVSRIAIRESDLEGSS